jgi:putative glutamine amidotransferase
MRKPVVGVIANTYRIENRFDIQSVGERNLRAVADVAGALPLVMNLKGIFYRSFNKKNI